MKRHYRTLLLILIDLILMNIAFLGAYLLRFDGSIPSHYFDVYKKVVLFVSAIKLAAFYFSGFYKSLWKYASVDEILKIVLVTAFGNIGSLAFVYIFTEPFIEQFVVPVPRSIYILSWILEIILIGGSRIAYRAFSRTNIFDILKNKGKLKKRCLIIGAGAAGAMVIKEMRLHEDLLRIPIAVIDDDVKKHGQSINNIPVVGGRNEIAAAVLRKKIDEIILAAPTLDNKNRKEIIEICNRTGIGMKILPGVYDLIAGTVSIRQLRPVEIEDLLGRDPVSLDIERISGYLKQAVVVVTGGGGSIGSELCRQISKYSPSKLIIVDIYENTAYDIQNELKKMYPELDLNVIITSITDRQSIFKIFEEYKPDVVFHAAAHKHVPFMEDAPGEAIKNNVFGTLNVIQAADKYNVKRFVQISTDKAVNPTNVMGATKRLCEMMIQTYKNISKTKFVAVRFGNVLGSNGSVIPLFKKQIKEGGPVTVTHPDIIRYFMTIPEAVSLVIQTGSMAEGGEIFVLNMGEPVKIDKLARDLIRLSGFEPDVDIEIKYSGLRPGEKLYEELLMEEEGLKDTGHEKIFVATPMDISKEELENKLKKLNENIDGENEKVVKTIQEVVPTYTPTPNSD